MVDHMVRKLGTYLRILGYDAEWDAALRTHELIARANAEGRVFLTRNTRLPYQYPEAKRAQVLRVSDPVEQLREVVGAWGLDTRAPLFSRCLRCNVELEAVADKRAIRDRVHPNVYARFERFTRCPRCGTVFWKGTHVANTCRKLGLEPPRQAPGGSAGHSGRATS